MLISLSCVTWQMSRYLCLRVDTAAGKYKSKFKASELENAFQVDVEGISDEKLLHSAVGCAFCEDFQI
jgi:hypothetical protein